MYLVGTKVTMDSNWRWFHTKGGYNNCYDGKYVLQQQGSSIDHHGVLIQYCKTKPYQDNIMLIKIFIRCCHVPHNLGDCIYNIQNYCYPLTFQGLKNSLIFYNDKKNKDHVWGQSKVKHQYCGHVFVIIIQEICGAVSVLTLISVLKTVKLVSWNRNKNNTICK